MKPSVLDIASLALAGIVGVPQIAVAMRPNRPRNLRTLAWLLGGCALVAGAAALVHWLADLPAARAALLGVSAALGIAWLLALVSLARHNTTM